MSAIPTGVILEAVNQGAATLPELKRVTGFNYPVLIQALEGDLSQAVRREETALGALRFYPLGQRTESKVERISPGPFCVKCRAECKKTHQAGMAAVGGEARWMCPKCKEGFPGTHTKRDVMAKLADYEAADRRLNEIIAAGQKQSLGGDGLKTPRTEAEDLCGCGKARNHKGICGKRSAIKPPVEEETKPRQCECGALAAPGGTLCWNCDAAKIKAGLAEVEVAPPIEAEPDVSPAGDTKGGLAEVLDFPDWTGLAGLKSDAKCSAPVTIDGGLHMIVSINIDPAEMVKWGSLRISNFWEGLAKVLRAVNGE